MKTQVINNSKYAHNEFGRLQIIGTISRVVLAVHVIRPGTAKMAVLTSGQAMDME